MEVILLNIDIMENIKCPKCGSEQISVNKKGFSGKNAVAGAVLTGGIGLLAGTIGSNKVMITCLNCGNVFKPGDRKTSPSASYYKSTAIISDSGKDAEILEFAKRDGKLAAVKFCKLRYEVDLSTANLYVDKLTKGLDLPKPVNKANKGCTVAMIIVTIVIVLIFLAIMLN